MHTRNARRWQGEAWWAEEKSCVAGLSGDALVRLFCLMISRFKLLRYRLEYHGLRGCQWLLPRLSRPWLMRLAQQFLPNDGEDVSGLVLGGGPDAGGGLSTGEDGPGGTEQLPERGKEGGIWLTPHYKNSEWLHGDISAAFLAGLQPYLALQAQIQNINEKISI